MSIKLFCGCAYLSLRVAYSDFVRHVTAQGSVIRGYKCAGAPPASCAAASKHHPPAAPAVITVQPQHRPCRGYVDENWHIY